MHCKPVFSPDGQWVTFVRPPGAPHGRNVVLFNMATGQAGPTFKGHAQPVIAAAFSADSRTVHTAATEGIVKKWELPLTSAGMTTSADAKGVRAQAVSADGARLATVLAKGASGPQLPTSNLQVTVQDVATRRTIWGQDIPGLAGVVEQLAFSLDDRFVAASFPVLLADSAEKGQVHIWEAATGKQVMQIKHPIVKRQRPTVSVFDVFRSAFTQQLAPTFTFSPTSQQIAVAVPLDSTPTAPGTIAIFDLTNAREPIRGQRVDNQATRIEYSPDGGRILTQETSTRGTAIHVWDAANGRVLWGVNFAAAALTFSRDGRRLCGFHQNQVIVWDAGTGREIARIANIAASSKLALSPDGQRVCLSIPSSFGRLDRRPGTVGIWDTSTGTRLYRLPGHTAQVTDIAFSPDGRRIVTTTGTTGETKVWDVASGQELLTLRGVEGELRFSADGRQLAGVTSQSPRDGAQDQLGLAQRVVIADASPLSPDVEAKELVETLFASRAADRLPTRGEIIIAIEEDASLSPAARGRALELAKTTRRDAQVLSKAAWTIAQQPGGPREDYQRAVDHAFEASATDASHPQAWLALGAAYYRLGEHAQALAALTRAGQLYAAGKQQFMPEQLAFLAMTHHQLQQADQARDFLRRGRETIEQSGSERLSEWRRTLAEAEKLLGVVRPRGATVSSIAGWGQAVDPLGDCQFTTFGDSLTIAVPPSLHDYTGVRNNYDSPRVIKDVEGDFTVQVKVTCPIRPQVPLAERSLSYFGAGFVILGSADHYVRVERNGYFRHPARATGAPPPAPETDLKKYSSNAPLVEYWRDGRELTAGRNNWNGARPLLPGSATWLRLQRRGANINVGISSDGQKYEGVYPLETNLPTKVQLGVMVINSSGSEFEATFSDWQLTQP
jgi:WD40 repeat protein/tetratricopeptide (TPR) repeat protein